jgi:predicted alpha/beta-fold hydrolase
MVFILFFLLLDRWIDNALDIKQVVDELKLKQNYDQLIAVGHSFGASSM